MKNILGVLRRAVPLMSLAVLVLSAHGTRAGSGGDLLLYAVHEFDGDVTYMLYDPAAGTSTPVYTTTTTGLSIPLFLMPPFSFSADGRLALACGPEANAYACVIDTQTTDSTPITINPNSPTPGHPLAWSADGRYLVFTVLADNSSLLLHVWDGETTRNITPDDLEGAVDTYYALWSPEGQLAFIVWYEPGIYYEEARSEVYVWSGDTITNLTQNPAGRVSGLAWSADGRLAFASQGEIYLWDGGAITNLSQNPARNDHAPRWSADGQLVFMSAQVNEYDILYWDGVSLKDGVPDADTFVNVAPDLIAYYSYFQWTNAGLLAFVATGPQDNRHAQIYVWDGEKATNLSQNPTLHNGAPTWTIDGRWAFATFFSSQQLVYVRDADNRTLLTVEGQGPVWSLNGYLAFCTYDRPNWLLSVWDGQQVTQVAQGSEVRAQWNGGAQVWCTSG